MCAAPLKSPSREAERGSGSPYVIDDQQAFSGEMGPGVDRKPVSREQPPLTPRFSDLAGHTVAAKRLAPRSAQTVGNAAADEFRRRVAAAKAMNRVGRYGRYQVDPGGPILKTDLGCKARRQGLEELVVPVVLERENRLSQDVVVLPPGHHTGEGRRRLHTRQTWFVWRVAWTRARWASSAAEGNQPCLTRRTQARKSTGQCSVAAEARRGQDHLDKR